MKHRPSIDTFYPDTIMTNKPHSEYKVTFDGGRTWTTCCVYSAKCREEIEASNRFGRAIRKRLDGDHFAKLLLDMLKKAEGKSQRSAKERAHILKIVHMLLERVPVDRSLSQLLAIQLELARRERNKTSTP